jgi:hypothetical protein
MKLANVLLDHEIHLYMIKSLLIKFRINLFLDVQYQRISQKNLSSILLQNLILTVFMHG